MSDKLNKTSSGAALTSVANHQASISGTGNDDPVLYMTNTWSYDFRLNDILIAPTFDKFIPSIGDRKIYKLAQLDMEKYCCATYDEKVAMISTVVALSKKQEPPARYFKLDEEKGMWYEVDDSMACVHVLHMFLEGITLVALSTATPVLGDQQSFDNEAPHGFFDASVIRYYESRYSNKKMTEDLGNTEEGEADTYREASLHKAFSQSPQFGFHTDDLILRKFRPDLHVPALSGSFLESSSDSLTASNGYHLATVSTALHNYEKFHGLKAGTACIAAVKSSSAGILGWASCMVNTGLSLTVAANQKKLSSPLTHDHIKSMFDKEVPFRYDRDVVAVALYNYELFHGLEAGSVSFALVEQTSAGIRGWASSVLHDIDSELPSKKVTDKIPGKCVTRFIPGDDEECRKYQMALLESIGVRVPVPKKHVPEQDSEFECDGGQDHCMDFRYEYSDGEEGDSEDVGEGPEIFYTNNPIQVASNDNSALSSTLGKRE